jgi:hypothetical protein
MLEPWLPTPGTDGAQLLRDAMGVFNRDIRRSSCL